MKYRGTHTGTARSLAETTRITASEVAETTRKTHQKLRTPAKRALRNAALIALATGPLTLSLGFASAEREATVEGEKLSLRLVPGELQAVRAGKQSFVDYSEHFKPFSVSGKTISAGSSRLERDMLLWNTAVASEDISPTEDTIQTITEIDSTLDSARPMLLAEGAALGIGYGAAIFGAALAVNGAALYFSGGKLRKPKSYHELNWVHKQVDGPYTLAAAGALASLVIASLGTTAYAAHNDTINRPELPAISVAQQ